jgi:hypothetical protein
MLRYLGERARREHLINFVPVQASVDAVNLPEPVDVALVVDTYHLSFPKIISARSDDAIRIGSAWQ